MHDAVHKFIQNMRDSQPSTFKVDSVLEVGSADINGSPRRYFKGARDYVGIDWKEGKGVDVVALAHQYDGRPNGYFQFVISTEMLEHDPHHQASIHRMVELLAVGGSLLITCAGPGRHSHDVSTSPSESYYSNLSLSAVLSAALSVGRFKRLYCEDDHVNHDIRFFGARKIR